MNQVVGELSLEDQVDHYAAVLSWGDRVRRSGETTAQNGENVNKKRVGKMIKIISSKFEF